MKKPKTRKLKGYTLEKVSKDFNLSMDVLALFDNVLCVEEVVIKSGENNEK
jgi:hypothetical protein